MHNQLYLKEKCEKDKQSIIHIRVQEKQLGSRILQSDTTLRSQTHLCRPEQTIYPSPIHRSLLLPREHENSKKTCTFLGDIVGRKDYFIQLNQVTNSKHVIRESSCCKGTKQSTLRLHPAEEVTSIWQRVFFVRSITSKKYLWPVSIRQKTITEHVVLKQTAIWDLKTQSQY